MSTAEERPDLENNDLVEYLQRIGDALRPYATLIAAAGGGLAAAAIAWAVINANLAATRQQSWDAYLAALTSGDTMSFNDVADRYPGTEAGMWSRLVLADMALTDGTVLAFRDRAGSRERLETAVELYTAVLAENPGGLVAERATFGLAKARESLGEIDAARRGYRVVADEFPESALAAVARDHAELLARDSTREWYDWFFAQEIRPPKQEADDAAQPAAAEK
jgi:hypothetical protein